MRRKRPVEASLFPYFDRFNQPLLTNFSVCENSRQSRAALFCDDFLLAKLLFYLSVFGETQPLRCA